MLYIETCFTFCLECSKALMQVLCDPINDSDLAQASRSFWLILPALCRIGMLMLGYLGRQAISNWHDECMKPLDEFQNRLK